ncbi:MAG: B12-binding domain-containing radical SAM protein [Deltaproteobacteria bacterium]|nr:B12-binding domain-containing radical SAM protein [Deltaproteobacteria bacterium]
MGNRVVIVEPSGAADNVFSRYMKLPLLGPVILGTVLRDAGFQVRILNESILGRPVGPSDLDADFLLVGGLTCSALRGQEIARMYRHWYPKGRVIMGGIHATFMPEEALVVADHVVTGEAENVIVDLLKSGSDAKIIAGSAVKNLDDLPSPDFSLLAGAERMNVAPVMTSRGCPFECSFCTVTRMFGRRYRTNSVDAVMRDLDRARQPFVFFYDDNLTADLRRAHDLCDAILRRRRRFQWSAQMRVDVARDPDLVAKMRAAGCCKVYIGLESVDEAALRAYRKRQSVQDVQHAVSVMHRNRIAVHGMFVLGCDDESATVAKDVLSYCLLNRIDTAQFLILTPFPGTPLFDSMKEQGRLLHTDWSYYDAMHVVFRPSKRTPLALQNEMVDAFSQFYSYRGALRDSFEAVTEAAGVVRRSNGARRVLSAERAALKVIGRTIVGRFLRQNAPYFGMLASQGP